MKQNGSGDFRKTTFHIIYIFLGLFVLMTCYFIYFILFQSDEVINNSYNKRQEVLAQRIVRGNILSSEGEILAKTLVDEKGNEVRNYPYGKVFAHVVGRFDYGKTGIEEAENIRLLTSNMNSLEVMYSDLLGEKSPGDNVITTLDVDLQQVAYDALGNYRGAAVVMEASTGKILTMVSKPSYDPNKILKNWERLIADDDSKAPLLNRATQGLYPPGSTFKVLTALEFMRENPDFRQYQYECVGSMEFDGMTIHCHNNKKHGNLDLAKSFAKSCNTSFANFGKDLDISAFGDLCEDFLFNHNLPVDMASNASQFTLEEGKSGVREVMQTVIGQGNTLITPLHNAMIVASVANEGIMMKPYVVDRIENAQGGLVKQYSSQRIKRLMSSAEAKEIKKMMRQVVTEGTATRLDNLKQEVAGKTGSADNAHGKAHSWFIGFAPYDRPEIVVSVIVENVGTGSEYAVPIAKKIFQEYFKK